MSTTTTIDPCPHLLPAAAWACWFYDLEHREAALAAVLPEAVRDKAKEFCELIAGQDVDTIQRITAAQWPAMHSAVIVAGTRMFLVLPPPAQRRLLADLAGDEAIADFTLALLNETPAGSELGKVLDGVERWASGGAVHKGSAEEQGERQADE